jgi:PHD/YefM family antitoxin component YafN of YafNO toxin-antitoxin module
MPHDLVTPEELEVGVTELRDSLGFTVRHVAESGTPIVVRRYRRAEVILVPLAEWRRLKQLEADLDEPDPFDFDDEL